MSMKLSRSDDEKTLARLCMGRIRILADSGKKTLKKINSIKKNIERNGEQSGIGKPETLKSFPASRPLFSKNSKALIRLFKADIIF